MTAIISTVLTCVVTLVGIFVSAKQTRDKVTNEMKTHNAVQDAEIAHIKAEIIEMKADIKSHNEYSKKFVEMRGELMVLENRESVSEHRIGDLEKICNETKAQIKQAG